MKTPKDESSGFSGSLSSNEINDIEHEGGNPVTLRRSKTVIGNAADANVEDGDKRIFQKVSDIMDIRSIIRTTNDSRNFLEAVLKPSHMHLLMLNYANDILYKPFKFDSLSYQIESIMMGANEDDKDPFDSNFNTNLSRRLMENCHPAFKKDMEEIRQ